MVFVYPMITGSQSVINKRLEKYKKSYLLANNRRTTYPCNLIS